MSALELNRIGFAQPTGRERARTRWKSALTHLIAFAALIAAIGVAAAAVSVGMSRAATLATISDDPAAGLALAILLGSVLVGMVGLTAATFSSSARSIRRG
jgi:hypothetical protein